MADLNLTKEERDIFEDAARDRYNSRSRIWFYGSVLLPLVAFAIYGTVKKDFVALLVAFGGLFLFVLWRLSHEFGHIETFKTASQKIAEHERHNT